MTLYRVKSRGNELVHIVEGLNEGGRIDNGRLPVVAYVVSNSEMTYVVDKSDLDLDNPVTEV